jgi:hypothetical protein
MTPEICLISVPHNGTMFTREIFVSNGWHEQSLNGRPNPTPTLYQGHCEKSNQVWQALDLGERMPIVMPLRHPYRVEESWRRRGLDPHRMVAAYRNMLLVLELHVAVWVPIDAVDLRKNTEEQLSDAAGKELKIDWDTLVNAEKNTHDIDISKLDPSRYMRDIRGHSLFREFYGDDDGPSCVRRAPHP